MLSSKTRDSWTSSASQFRVSPSWNTMVPNMESDVFGTVSTTPPQDAVVNTAQCLNYPYLKDLGFVFKLAQNIDQKGDEAVFYLNVNTFNPIQVIVRWPIPDPRLLIRSSGRGLCAPLRHLA